MKSFFNFLRNNKAYAVIDVFGMSVSFMFVILIGAYAWQETHIGHCHDKADRIYAMGFTSQSGNRLCVCVCVCVYVCVLNAGSYTF